LSAIIISLIPFATLSLEHMKEKQMVPQLVNMSKTLSKIKSSMHQGKVVFVDVTADWCLTCKANEFLVLDTENVKNLMKKK
jgi:suppressor for copper-sensitivity B